MCIRDSDGVWDKYIAHGALSWTAVDVAINEQGDVIVGATKSYGRLYTHSGSTDGAWSPWVRHGLDTWSAQADVSVSIDDTGTGSLVSVKENGLLYNRSQASTTWAPWSSVGAGNWAAGS